MTRLSPIEYAQASPAVRAVFDDIKATRGVPDVNNFWKYLAHDPKTLRRTWESIKEVMAPGALDPVVKEMIYVAVSVSNGCSYCIASHGTAARAQGMTEAMFGELVAVVGMANETNRLVNAYRVPVDAAYNQPPAAGGLRITVRRAGAGGRATAAARKGNGARRAQPAPRATVRRKPRAAAAKGKKTPGGGPVRGRPKNGGGGRSRRKR